MQNHLALFAKNHFPATFGGHLEFLGKTQKFFLGNGATVRGFNEFFWPQGMHRVICHFLPIIVFLPFLVVIFNFCIKLKTESHLALFQKSIFLPIFAG